MYPDANAIFNVVDPNEYEVRKKTDNPPCSKLAKLHIFTSRTLFKLFILQPDDFQTEIY